MARTPQVHLFVATLGYSRRLYVLAFLHERQSAWLQGLEGAFRHFGGVPREVLVDNARALVNEHDAQTREVAFNDRFHAFCRYWGVTPRACAPYRARTKGKDERGVGYVKRNAIAGHRFVVPGGTAGAPGPLDARGGRRARARHHRRAAHRAASSADERSALAPLAAKAPFLQVRELSRRVHTDACIELDTNRYSVPWKLIGETVTVVVAERQVRVLYAGQEVACHAQNAGRRMQHHRPQPPRGHRRHSFGRGELAGATCPAAVAPPAVPAELLRPLDASTRRQLGGAW